MLIIADGGSTKTNWCLLRDEGVRIYFDTEGYNPYFVDSDYIVSSLRICLPKHIDPAEKGEIHFYGAGVQNAEKAQVLKTALETIFSNSSTYVEHDLLASARALLGFNRGFAAILGTGTNSCLYNGEEITHHVDSGAHILGDEGSGFYIGKKLLIDYMRGNMPQLLSDDFKATYNLTSDDIHGAVYSEPLANGYCAGFSKFIGGKYINTPYAKAVLRDSFNDFFRNIVSRYPDYRKYKFNCIGSIGFSFSTMLKQVSAEWDMEFGQIIKSPIENLIDYHFGKQGEIIKSGYLEELG